MRSDERRVVFFGTRSKACMSCPFHLFIPHTYCPFLQPPNPKPHHHYCPTNYTLKFYFFFFILSAPPLARLAPHHQPHRLQKPFDSRLARNSNRVNSLNAKLQLKLSNIHKCDLRPVETEIRPEDLSTPIISSVSQGSSECFARIGVGTPTNQCEPCSDCYQETDPIFQPESSSSYSPLTSDSRQCVALETFACRNNRCLYQVAYGDGSYTVGDFVAETLSFGSSRQLCYRETVAGLTGCCKAN
uniref:Xylanase inhibitor N-terminal domain-containing protein n=1 Tax=Cannabis sativa TaxID=3483 RepID=A0A803NZG4_CANSA